MTRTANINWIFYYYFLYFWIINWKDFLDYCDTLISSMKWLVSFCHVGTWSSDMIGWYKINGQDQFHVSTTFFTRWIITVSYPNTQNFHHRLKLHRSSHQCTVNPFFTSPCFWFYRVGFRAILIQVSSHRLISIYRKINNSFLFFFIENDNVKT